MKIIDSSPIQPGAAMPFKKGTFDFLRVAHQEMVSELVQEIWPNIGAEDFPWTLRGCSYTVTGGTYQLQPGAVYVGANLHSPVPPATTGELFILPNVQTVTPVNHAILVVAPLPLNAGGPGPFYTDVAPNTSYTTEYYAPSDGTADPVTFTNNDSYYVHNNRTLILTDGDITTPGFVTYLNPDPAPNSLVVGGLPTVLIYAGSPYVANGTAIVPGNLIKAVDQYGAVGIPSDNTTIIPISNTLTPSSTLNSNSMTVRFSASVNLPGGLGYLTVWLCKNGSATGDAIRAASFGNTSLSNDVVAYFETVVTYNHGDTFSVIARGSGGPSGGTVTNSCLICECFDAYLP